MTNTPHDGAQAAAPRGDAHLQDTRVLRRAEPLSAFPCTDDPIGPFTRVAIVDVETTGTDTALDQVIDIAVALVSIDTHGRVAEVIAVEESLRNPGRPVPEIVTALTGISDDDVAEVDFDERPFVDLLCAADICIAHNAKFDAMFVERLMPDAAGLSWACSMSEFDWVRAGYDGAKLGHLLMQMGKFSDTHRAISDVTALLHVLAQPHGSEVTILNHVLGAALRNTIRVEATGAPYHRRGELKDAGYKWDGDRKVWWLEVEPKHAEAEADWLIETVLPARQQPRLRTLSCRERHR